MISGKQVVSVLSCDQNSCGDNTCLKCLFKVVLQGSPRSPDIHDLSE